MKSYYDVLGISEKASSQEIKAAYRELMKKYHPDKNPDDKEAIKKSQLINQAYAVLVDPIKRVEYDNLQEMQYQESRAYGQTKYASQNYDQYADNLPNISCEMCGRKDPTLRVTIFVWVISLLFFTSKNGWGHILCSRCRIKYSLLFNIQVFLMGWWGIPFGPIYSIEALLQNSFGGIQPETNNSDLLAVLAYDFYLQGRYKESHQSIKNSVELRPNKNNQEFLSFIKRQVSKKAKYDTSKHYNINPAFINIPVLIILFLLGISYIIPGYSISTSFVSQDTENYDTGPTISRSDELENILIRDYDIDVDYINRLFQDTRTSYSHVVSYLEDNTPYSGTEYISGERVRVYDYDIGNFSESEIIGPLLTIKDNLVEYYNILENINSVDLTESEYSGDYAKLKDNIVSQYKYMSSIYFNTVIIHISIPTVTQYYRDLIITKENLHRTRNIVDNVDIDMWLHSSGYKNKYDKLVATLSEIKDYTTKLSDLENILNSLDEEIEYDEIRIAQMKERMEEYLNRGNISEHDKLVEPYNKIIDRFNDNIDQYDRYVYEYNLYLDDLDELSLAQAFNNCLDEDIIFPAYDYVELN